MTYSINGIGTQHYGVRNEVRRNDVCPHCGREVSLKSYDTTKYFVVFFIPLIPLKKLRIVDDCSFCRRWTEVRLADWEERKQTALRECLEQLKANDTDPQAVAQAIATATSFQDESILLQFRELAMSMTDHAEVQRTLASALAYFGNHQDAIVSLRHALEAEDTRPTRVQLAAELVQVGKTKEADACLAYIWEDNSPEHVGLWRMIAEGYQQESNHEATLECINRMLTLEPSLESDKEFKAFRKKAEKYRKKNTVLAAPKGTARPQNSNTSRLDLAKWIGPAVAILLIGGYFATAIWRGMSREVDVVNGLSIPYTATVNGQIVPLEPHSRRSITISEGQATVSGASDEVAIPERTITVKTPFWTRPFKQHRFVINPDEAAAIGRATIVYGDRNAEPQVTTSAGQFLYSYEGIDHPFEEPPQTIEVSNDGIGYRDILFLLSPDTEFVYLSRQEQVTILKNRLKFAKGARSIPIMRVLAELAEPEDFLNVATTFIAERPLLVEWHRVYQTISESARPDHDLISEYKAQLAQDPNNSDLLYLTARLHTDLRQRRELLKRALDVDPNSPYANHGLGYELLASGRFDRAMSYATTAWQADPSNTLFATLYYYCLIANENFDGAIEIIETSGLVDSVQTLVQTIPLLVAKGEAPTAADAINAFVKASYGETPSAQRDMLQNALQDVLDYAAGNFDDLNARYADELNNVEPSFQVLVSQGRLAEASDLLDANVMVLSGFEPTLFFLISHFTSPHRVTTRRLWRLVNWSWPSSCSRPATRTIDRWQTYSRIPNMQATNRSCRCAGPVTAGLSQQPLAKRIPKHQGQYRQLAEKLNFERTFPYWELKRDLERTTGFE